MKKIFKFAAIVAAAAALFSCQEKPTPEPTPDPEKPNQEQPGQTEPNENIKFTIELTDVTENTAKFKVKHDGTKADTWHYFVTTESDINQAISTEVAALAEGGKSLQTSTSKNVTVRSLEPETEYTFVVFGVTTEGVVYGEPATQSFQTTAAPLEGFQVNPAWTITYIGDYEQEGQLFTHVAMLESTDENPYFLTAWPKAAFEQTGIEAVAEGEIAAWLEYLSGSQYTFADLLTVGSTMETFADVIDTQYGLEWYIIAIGAEPEGKATGYYAMSDLITIVEEDMTEGYAAWLGDWTITGANGNTQNVKFSIGKANKTYKMSGYEGDDAAGLDVTVNWLEEDGIWVIYNQKIGTFNFGEYGPGDVWFLGEGENEDIYLSEVPICIGGTLEDGSLAAYGYEEEFELEDGTPMTYKVVTMEYLAYLTEYGQLSYITGTYQTGYPTFPMTFTPATKATTCSVSEFKPAKKSLNNFNEFKTFGTKNAVIR